MQLVAKGEAIVLSATWTFAEARSLSFLNWMFRFILKVRLQVLGNWHQDILYLVK